MRVEVRALREENTPCGKAIDTYVLLRKENRLWNFPAIEQYFVFLTQ